MKEEHDFMSLITGGSCKDRPYAVLLRFRRGRKKKKTSLFKTVWAENADKALNHVVREHVEDGDTKVKFEVAPLDLDCLFQRALHFKHDYENALEAMRTSWSEAHDTTSIATAEMVKVRQRCIELEELVEDLKDQLKDSVIAMSQKEHSCENHVQEQLGDMEDRLQAAHNAAALAEERYDTLFKLYKEHCAVLTEVASGCDEILEFEGTGSEAEKKIQEIKERILEAPPLPEDIKPIQGAGTIVINPEFQEEERHVPAYNASALDSENPIYSGYPDRPPFKGETTPKNLDYRMKGKPDDIWDKIEHETRIAELERELEFLKKKKHGKEG